MSTVNLERLRKLMRRTGLDALLATRPHSVAYLTDRFGIVRWDYPNVAHCLERMDDGCRVQRFVCVPLADDVSPFIVCHPGAIPRLNEPCWITDIRFACARSGEPASEVVARALNERGLEGATIGVEMAHIPVSDFEALRRSLPRARFVDCSEILWNVRMVKTHEELSRMSTAYRMAEEIYEGVFQMMREGASPAEIRAFEMAEAIKRGCPPLEFGYVRVGRPGEGLITDMNRPIARGDIVQLDIGLMNQGYLTDFARTVSIGTPPTEVRRTYELMLSAFNAMAEFVRAGVRADEVWAKGFDHVGATGWSRDSALGHGLGRECHEPPLICAYDQTVLEEGMVLVLELSRLVAGAPLHLEHAGVVTARGWRLLTSLDTEMFIL